MCMHKNPKKSVEGTDFTDTLSFNGVTPNHAGNTLSPRPDKAKWSS